MRLKPRTIPVIALSSLIIASVLALTIFGFRAYLEWKEKNIRRNYRLLLEDVNVELFAKYIIMNLQAKIKERGDFEGESVVSGTIKNTSKKKLYSLSLKVSFSDKNGKVVYIDTFYPIGPENFLAEGDSVSFTHQLRNYPQEVLDYLKSKLKFAKSRDAEPLKFTYKIEGMVIK